MRQQADFRLQEHHLPEWGEVVLLCALTPGAQTWIDENLFEDGDNHEGKPVILPDYVASVLEGIREAGLEVAQ